MPPHLLGSQYEVCSLSVAIPCNNLSQTTLINKILTLFSMVNCNPVSTLMESSLVPSRQTDTLTCQELDLLNLPYHCLISLLMYLAIATCPDIAFAICKLSQFMNYYRTIHWNAAKHVV